MLTVEQSAQKLISLVMGATKVDTSEVEYESEQVQCWNYIYPVKSLNYHSNNEFNFEQISLLFLVLFSSFQFCSFAFLAFLFGGSE